MQDCGAGEAGEEEGGGGTRLRRGGGRGRVWEKDEEFEGGEEVGF